MQLIYHSQSSDEEDSYELEEQQSEMSANETHQYLSEFNINYLFLLF
jgi:hypothetical protein